MNAIISIKPASRWHNEIKRFSRFLAVGLSGTLLDFAVLSLLKQVLEWATLPANIFSYSCGILSNFLLNLFWVYPESKGNRNGLKLVQFFLISLVGLALNNLLLVALEGPMGVLFNNPDYGYLPAKIIATMLVLLWNFFANRFWTFGKVANVKNITRQGHDSEKNRQRPAA